jgi:hypothetical protein
MTTRIVLLLSLAFAAAALSAPSASPGLPPGLAATGAFFALSVADARASAQWYEEKLGLAVVMAPPKQGKSSVIVLEGGGLIVELIQDDDARPLEAIAPSVKSHILVHGPVKAGAVVSDFDGLLDRLRRRNVTIAFGPYPARADQRANVIIQDNAGNFIQFFGPSFSAASPAPARP